MTNLTDLKVKKHKDKPGLTGEHPFGDLGQLIFLVFFILVWMADVFIIKLSETAYFNFPLEIRILLSIIILLLGFYLSKKSIRMIFGTKQENPQIIDEKIYNKIRHPMYLGSLLVYLGITILTFSLPLFVIFIVIFIFYNYIAKYEEKLLLNRYGDDYAKYMKRVGRWIPKW